MQTVGGYEVLGQLGRGGAGVVYRARDPASGREVALKVLAHASDVQAQRRFQREAEALARVRHPHVVSVYTAGVDDRGGAFLALELVTGEDLAARVARDGPLEPRAAAALVADAATGLEAAHRAGVVHRDLKPANLLLGEDGRVRVTDFGLVRDLDPRLDATRLSQTGVFLGTPAYWPPEQARGDHRAVDARSDVYGLGGTLYTLLVGEAPQEGASLGECLARLQAPPPAPSQVDPRVPAALDAIVLRCLARAPEARYPSAQAVADDLRRFLAGQRLGAGRWLGRATWLRILGGVVLTSAGAAWFAQRALTPQVADPSPPRVAAPSSPPVESPAPPVGPHERLVAAGAALRRNPGREAYDQLAAALVAVYDPGRDHASLAQAASLLDPEADPYQRAGAQLLDACAYRPPSQLDARGWSYAFVDDDSWSTLAGGPPWRPTGLRLRPDHELLSVFDMAHLIEQLERARPELEGQPPWWLLVRRFQQAAADALLMPANDLSRDADLPAEAGRALIAFEPASLAARRLELVLYYRGLEDSARALPARWEEPDDERCFRLLQRGLELPYGEEPAAFAEQLEQVRADWTRLGQAHPHRHRALLFVSARGVEWAYLHARRRGGPLTPEQLAAFVAISQGTTIRALSFSDRLRRIGLELLGPTPDAAWELLDQLETGRGMDDRILLAARAEIHAACGDLAAARALALEQGVASLGLAKRLGLNPDDYDLAPTYHVPWHAAAYVDDVIANDAWCPGRE